MFELVEGLVLDHVDAREPVFAPAPAQAAGDVADARLTDAELSQATTAARLHVSLRALRRACAGLRASAAAAGGDRGARHGADPPRVTEPYRERRS